MHILVLNPNTTAAMTENMAEQARRHARAGTEIEAVTAAHGAASIEGHYEAQNVGAAMLETIKIRAPEFDGVVIAGYGDPGLYPAREISPVPVVGIAEASMLMACTIAHKFTIVTVLSRIRPMLENVVRLHGLESRCASIRTTPLSVLDCERDPARAEREIIKAAMTAVAEDSAEAILLGCGGMGPLDQRVGSVIDVPVLDGIACGVKLLEGIDDYGLKTSRKAAFKEPESKGSIGAPELEVARD